MNKVYIGLSSNIGDTANNIRTAITELGNISILCGQSSLYLTKPWGYLDQADFINAVAAINTEDSPQELLKKLQAIEKKMGRQETPVRWGPRLIDLDILTFGDIKITGPGLTIPHPLMLDRAFVLAPLSELDNTYNNAYLNLSESLRLQVKRL